MDVCASFHIYELNKMQVRLDSHSVQPIVNQTNELLIKLWRRGRRWFIFYVKKNC